MTVALLAKDKTSGENIYQPVSFEETFRNVWLKGADAIGATWFPGFEIGADFGIAEKDEILDELRRFFAWVHTADLSDGDRNVSKIASIARQSG